MRYALLACLLATGAATVGGSWALAASPTAEHARRCPASAVHYGTHANTPQGVGGPWITTRASLFYGELFYYGSTSWKNKHLRTVRIFTPSASRSVHPKVLWLARAAGLGTTLGIKGRRLDAPGAFSSHSSLTGENQFPSYVEAPRAGCWRVTLTSGRLTDTAVFSVVDHL